MVDHANPYTSMGAYGLWAVRLWAVRFVQLRFIGLGNLVIVPASIAPQWQQEIQKLCTQEQAVMVLDSLKDRRRFMTSKDGLEEYVFTLRVLQDFACGTTQSAFLPGCSILIRVRYRPGTCTKSLLVSVGWRLLTGWSQPLRKQPKT